MNSKATQWQCSPQRGLQFVRRLGEGAFGTVFELTKLNPDPGFGNSSVAVKQISIELYKHIYPHEEYPVTRMQREIAILQDLRGEDEEGSGNVVKYFDHWFEGVDTADLASLDHSPFDDEDYSPDVPPPLRNWLFIEMELCGSTLQEWILKRPRQEERRLEEVSSILKQLLKALGYIHGRRLIHRDIKPDNVFITKNSGSEEEPFSVKLGDFGLSKMLQGDKSRVTTEKAGSMRFQSPEMLRGDGRYSEKTDIFSTGLVFLQVLFAQESITFVKDIRDIFSILQNRAETTVLDCPDMLIFPLEVALVKKMTAFSQVERYSAEQALEALKQPDEFLEKITLERKREATLGFNVISPVFDFVGREAELESLRTWWEFTGSGSTLVLLTGLAGVGKTELLRKHVDTIWKEGLSHVIWLDGTSAETLDKSTQNLAQHLDTSTTNLVDILRKLPKKIHSPKSISVVIDNLPFQSSHIPPFVEDCKAAGANFILLVSRCASIRNNVSIKEEMRVGNFSEEVAVRLLGLRLGSYMNFNMDPNSGSHRLASFEMEALQEVAHLLNCHPLSLTGAIRQIQGMISSRSRNLSNLLALPAYIKEIKQGLLTSPRGASPSLYDTLDEAISEVFNNGGCGKFAQDVLQLLSYCYPMRWISLAGLMNTVENLVTPLQNPETLDLDRMSEAIQNLLAFSLVLTETGGHLRPRTDVQITGIVCDIVQLRLRITQEETKFVSMLLRNMKPFKSLEWGLLNLWKYCTLDMNRKLRESLLEEYKGAIILLFSEIPDPSDIYKENKVNWIEIREQLQNRFGPLDASTITIESLEIATSFAGTDSEIKRVIDLYRRGNSLEGGRTSWLNLEIHFPQFALKLMTSSPDVEVLDLIVEWYLEMIQSRGKFLPTQDQLCDTLLFPLLSLEIKSPQVSSRLINLLTSLWNCYLDVGYISPLQLLVPLRLAWFTLKYQLGRQTQNGVAGEEILRRYPIFFSVEDLFRSESVLSLGVGFSDHYLFREMSLLSKFCLAARGDATDLFVLLVVDMFALGKHPIHIFQEILDGFHAIQNSPALNVRVETLLQAFDNALTRKVKNGQICFTYGYNAMLEVVKCKSSIVKLGQRTTLDLHFGPHQEVGKDETLIRLNCVMRAVVQLSYYGDITAQRLMKEQAPGKDRDELSVESGDFIWISKATLGASQDKRYVRGLMKETVQSTLTPVMVEAIAKCKQNPELFEHVVLHFPDLLLGPAYFSKLELFDPFKHFEGIPGKGKNIEWLDFLTVKLVSLLSYLDLGDRTDQNFIDVGVLLLILLQYPEAGRHVEALVSSLMTIMHLDSAGRNTQLKTFCGNLIRLHKQGMFDGRNVEIALKSYCASIVRFGKEELKHVSLEAIKNYRQRYARLESVGVESYQQDLQELLDLISVNGVEDVGGKSITVNIAIALLIHGLGSDFDVRSVITQILKHLLRVRDNDKIVELGRLLQIPYSQSNKSPIGLEEFNDILGKCEQDFTTMTGPIITEPDEQS